MNGAAFGRIDEIYSHRHIALYVGARFLSQDRNNLRLSLWRGKVMRLLTYISALCVVFMLACGGSSSDGVYFNGILNQGESVAHSDNVLRHAAGQNIENVEICALGECSTTDSNGAWAFEAPESFNGGEVEFTIKGHGIDTTQIVDVPDESSEIFVHFQRIGQNDVIVHHLIIDGVNQHEAKEK